MNAMQPPQSVEEVKATLETTEKGGVRQSIRNCLTVFQRDPVLAGAIAYNILTDRKDIMSALTKIKQDTFLSKFILISNPSRRWNRSLPDLFRRDGSLKKYHIDFLYAAARHRAEFYT